MYAHAEFVRVVSIGNMTTHPHTYTHAHRPSGGAFGCHHRYNDHVQGVYSQISDYTAAYCNTLQHTATHCNTSDCFTIRNRRMLQICVVYI